MRLVVGSLLCFVSPLVSSATLSGQSVSIAEAIGLTGATFGGDGAPHMSTRLGLAGGGFLVLEPFAPFSMQLGLEYTTMTASTDVQTFTDSTPSYLNFRDRTVQRRLTLRGVGAEALFGIALRKQGVRLGIGPGISFNASCDLYSDFTIERLSLGTWELSEVAGSVDCGDNLETVHWSLVLGAGVDIRLGATVMTLDARYHHGVTVAYHGTCTGTMRELDGAPGCYDNLGFEARTRVLTVSVGLRLGGERSGDQGQREPVASIGYP